MRGQNRRQQDLSENLKEQIYSSLITYQRGELESREEGETKFWNVSTEIKKTYISMEIEVDLTPNMNELRRIYRSLGSPSLNKVATTTSNPALIAVSLVNRLVDLINQDDKLSAYNDSGLLEINVPPATLLAHKFMFDKYKYLSEFFQRWCLTPSQDSGIHLNIDLGNFGETSEEIVENVKNFLWFLYENREVQEFNNFIGREGLSSFQSDILAQLGDPLGLLSEGKIKERFFSAKEEILSCLSSSSPSITKPLNLTVFKAGRRALEWRWFGSSTDIHKLYSLVELAFVLPKFVKLGSSNWSEFVAFIHEENLDFLPSNFYYND